MSARIPPQHLEAEQSIIGGLMLDHEALDQIADLIDTPDFYKPANQKIYQAIKDLHGKNQPIDIITVTNLLQSRNELESSGGPEYLVSLLDKTISAANILTHAEIVREKSLLRRLIATSNGLIERAYSQDYADIESLIDQAEAEVLKVGENKSKQGLVGSMEIVKSSIEKIEELFKRKADITGLATGFKG